MRFFKKCNFLLVVSNTQFWVHFELQLIFVFHHFLCSKNEASRDRKRDSRGNSEDINHITTETHHYFWSRSFMFRSILSHIISYLFNFVLSSATSCARSTSARWWRRLVYLGQSSASTRRFTRHSCNRTTFLTKDDFKESHTIHLIPKWRPINYSFVSMFISPLCLIFTSKFFCVLYMLTRHQGLINLQTKE